MASVRTKQRDRQRYPKIEKKIKESIDKLIETNGYCNLLGNSDDVFNWWVSNKSVQEYKLDKRQMKLEI